jgi:cation transport regulator ChaB
VPERGGAPERGLHHVVMDAPASARRAPIVERRRVLMPRGSKGTTKPEKVELPGTLKRSPAKAQRTFAETLASAHETYGGDEERAHRTAMAAVKHSFEKVGDHWEPKRHKGPSDPQARRGGAVARHHGRRGTAGGVDVAGHTKRELMQRAKRLGVRGRSRMRKLELAQAIARAQD